MKVIGITCGTAKATAASPVRESLNRAYVRAVEQAGGLPLIIPVIDDPTIVERYLGIIDGLLLSGGVDIAPSYYGEAPHAMLEEVDPDRDAAELPLLRSALAQDMPIFAICRGMQALNVVSGGTLYQDLRTERPSAITHQQHDAKIPRERPSHSVQVEPGSRLRSVVGSDEILTNSFHHQALKDVAPELTATAYAPDGVIEAVESNRHRYVVGVQFHPEETAPNDAVSRSLFTDFIRAVSLR